MSERVPAQTKNSAKPSMAAQQSSSLFEQRPFTDERYQSIAKDSKISTESPTIAPKNARPRLNLLEIMLQQSSGKTANQTGAIQRQPTEEANEEESTNLQMQPEGSIQLKCSKYEQEEKEKNLYLKSETLQRQAEDNHDWQPSPAASALQRRANSAFIPKPQVNLKTNGAGSSLPKPVQQKMSAAFGANFSDVRIHEGAQAKSINALAYTQGNHIHFAPGKYNPTSEDGQKLLGHELTHVVQQRAGRVPIPQGKGTPINADPALEAEADDLGAKAAQGKSVTVAGASSGVQQKSAQTIPIQRFKLFSKIANTVKNKASSAVNAVKSGVNTVKNTAQSGVKAVTNKVSSGVSAVKNKVSSGVNTVKRGFSKAKNKVSSGVNRVKRGFNTVKNTVKNKVSRGVNRVKRGINTVKNQAKRAYNTVKKKVASKFKAVKRGVNLVKNQAKRAYNATKNQVKRGFNAVKNKVGNNLNIAKRGFNAVKNGIKRNFNAVKNKVSSGFNTAKQTFNAAKNGVKSAYNTVKNKVSSGFNTVKEGLKNVNWRDVGHAALDVAGFIPVVGAVADVANAAWYLAEGDYTNAALSGISAIPGIGDAIGGVAKGGKAAFKLGKAGNMLGKANKLLPNAGKLVGKAGGLANKVSSSAGKLVGKVGGLANKIPPGIKSVTGKVMGGLKSIPTKVKGGLNAAKDKIVGGVKRGFNAGKNKVTSGVSTAKRGLNVGKNKIVGGVKRGFNAGKNKVTSGVSTAKRGLNVGKNKIVGGVKRGFNAGKNKVTSGVSTTKRGLNAGKNKIVGGAKRGFNKVKTKYDTLENTVSSGGTVKDATDAALALAEGNFAKAALSGFSALPGISNAIGFVGKRGKAALARVKGSKLFNKGGKSSPNVGKLQGIKSRLSNKVPPRLKSIVSKTKDRYSTLMNTAEGVGTTVNLTEAALSAAEGDYGKAAIAALFAYPGLRKGGSAVFNKAKRNQRLKNVLSKTKGGFTSLPNKVKGGFSAFKGKVKGGFNTVKGKVKGGFNTVKERLKKLRRIRTGSNNRGLSPNVERYWKEYEEAVGTQGDDLQSLIESARRKGITINPDDSQASFNPKTGVIGVSSGTKKWEFFEEFLHKKVADGWKAKEIAELSKRLKKVKDYKGHRSVSAPGRSAEEIMVKQWLLQHGRLVGVGEAEKTLLRNQIDQLGRYGTGRGY